MTIPILPHDELPDEYQEQDVRRIFNVLNSGEPCALMAVGSAGKSNLLRFIMKDRIKARYLGPEMAPTFITVMVNAHDLITLEGEALQQSGKGWPGYELMLFRLYCELAHVYDNRAFNEEQKKKVLATYQKVEHYYGLLFGPEPLRIQTHVRNLERAIDEVFDMGSQWRIVYLFDDMEECIRVLPIEFFQSLRGLRDAYKGRLMYVAASRDPLPELVQTIPAPDVPPARRTGPFTRINSVMENFVELFSANTWYLQPLDPISAAASVKRYFARSRHQLDHVPDHVRARVQERMIQATGGHAGLLKASFWPAIDAVNQLTDHAFEAELIKNPGVQSACQAIVHSLTKDEETALRHLAQMDQIQEGMACRTLLAKHLIRLDGGQYHIRFPVLRTFLLKPTS